MGEKYSDKLRCKNINMKTKGQKRKRMLLNSNLYKNLCNKCNKSIVSESKDKIISYLSKIFLTRRYSVFIYVIFIIQSSNQIQNMNKVGKRMRKIKKMNYGYE